MIFLLRVICFLAFLVAAAWFYFKPAWDSGSTSLVTLAGFIGSFIGNAEQKKRRLSKKAKRLLKEIDSSRRSKMKGISLMMVDAVSGFYRPFIWSNSAHGAVTEECHDMGIILSAVHELTDKGFLTLHDQPSKALTYYRRTDKKRMFWA